MAGKAPKGGNAYKLSKPLKRAPRPKKSYGQRAMSMMKKRLKPQK